MADRGPVLVVDDDESIRQFIRMALTMEGYDVVTVADGQAALDAVAVRSPRVILLDMRMPVMDGWQFARLYRERPGASAAIVVLTAARDAAASAAAIRADAFLSKPFELRELLGVVARLVAVG